jgi:trehalose 6-phosphate synthase/phosphatase
MAKTIIVSNRLPVSVKKVNGKLEFYPSSGGLATSMAGFSKQKGTVWIGWPGVVSEDITARDKQTITTELAKQNCKPIFLSRHQFEDFYNGYSNSVLWPLLHTMSLADHIPGSWWKMYKEVNELFAQEVLNYQKPNSKVWVHDYQLLLLPQLIRKDTPTASIGFFLHIPFPEASQFLKLKEASALIRGVLGADLAGFHTPSYVANFQETAKALDVGTPAADQIILHGRNVRVADFPIGIDYDKFSQATRSRAVRKHSRKLRRKYGKYKTILTVDRLDPTKAFPERLRAYHTLLKKNPALLGKVIMVMIAVPSRTEIETYQKLKDEVDKLVAKTNESFGTRHWKPIDFRYTSVPFEELSALYRLADVAFVAPLRDGMNLVAKEYIASKTDGSGALILSQTAGAAEELEEAILVNPRQQHSLVRALGDALLTPPAELQKRVKNMQEIVAGNGVQRWAGSFLGSLRQSTALRKSSTRTVTKKISTDIQTAFRNASHPLLLLDYDGVLVPFYDHPKEAKPDKQLLKLLQNLSEKPYTDVVVVSGRKQKDLDGWLGKLPITLASEHSATMRSRGKSWKELTNPDASWKKIIRPVLEKYALLTPGAEVEEKSFSLVWHYRTASPYYTQKNLVALRPILHELAQKYGLGVHGGNKIIEIKPLALNKGVIATKSLRPSHDFVLVIGDDYTDEQMFVALPPSTFTIKVGPGRSAARYRMKNVDAVRKLLEQLLG